MVDFSDQFQHFLPPAEEAISDAFANGFLVFDTNVLLGIYRFAPQSRNELLNALSKLQGRLWIPHQVGLEFHRNRLNVIAEYDAAYRGVLEAYEARQGELEADTEKKIRELSNRVALSDSDRKRLLDLLKASGRPLPSAIERLRADHGVGGPTSRDSILERVRKILSGRVGDPFSPEELSAELAEAESRIAQQRPPGYKDSSKSEPHGDYFVWSQTLKEAAKRQAKILLFVTGDVKDDWYLRVKGQTVMARPELALECTEKSGAKLVMLPTRAFLSYAKKFLEIEVSDETIRQAESASLSNESRNAAKAIAEAARHELLEAEDLMSKAERFASEYLTERASLVNERQGLVGRIATARGRLSEMNTYIENTGTSKGSSAILRAQAELNDLLDMQAHLETRLVMVDSRLADANEVLSVQRRRYEEASHHLATLKAKTRKIDS